MKDTSMVFQVTVSFEEPEEPWVIQANLGLAIDRQIDLIGLAAEGRTMTARIDCLSHQTMPLLRGLWDWEFRPQSWEME